MPCAPPSGPPSRRQVLEAFVAAGTAFATGLGCVTKAAPAPPGGGDAGLAPPVPYEKIPLGRVALVRAATPEEAVARALWLTGGLSFVRPGQKVLIKPNFTGPIPPPDTTSPAVLVEVIRRAFQAGAAQVIVAERSFTGSKTASLFDWKLYDGYSKSMRDYIAEAGATFRPLDDEPWDAVSPAGATDFDGPILIPRILSEVDHFVNVPALKTHNEAVITMCMKNLFGFVHPDSRQSQVHKHPKNKTDPERPKRCWAQMGLAFHPALSVLDAIVSRVTEGPVGGKEAATNLVLAGKDRVAMDAVGTAILRVVGTETWIADKPVWKQVQIAEAVKIGLGVKGPDEIEIVSEGVAEIAEIEKKLRET